MKLSIKALALASAILWGGCVLVVALANSIWPGYGAAFLEMCGSIYPGYYVAHSVSSIAYVTLYGLADGLIGGAVLAWLYNSFAG